MQEKQVPRRLVVFRCESEQACWYPSLLFLNLVRPRLWGKMGPSLLKATSLQTSRVS